MNNLKLEQIAYAQGWIEGHLESMLAAATTEEQQRDMEELIKTFKILSDGFDDVRRENQKFERTLMMVRGAVQL